MKCLGHYCAPTRVFKIYDELVSKISHYLLNNFLKEINS